MMMKPPGRGMMKMPGQKPTTGNPKKMAATKGKGGALRNKLAGRRGQKTPYSGGKKK